MIDTYAFPGRPNPQRGVNKQCSRFATRLATQGTARSRGTTPSVWVSPMLSAPPPPHISCFCFVFFGGGEEVKFNWEPSRGHHLGIVYVHRPFGSVLFNKVHSQTADAGSTLKCWYLTDVCHPCCIVAASKHAERWLNVSQTGKELEKVSISHTEANAFHNEEGDDGCVCVCECVCMCGLKRSVLCNCMLAMCVCVWCLCLCLCVCVCVSVCLCTPMCVSVTVFLCVLWLCLSLWVSVCVRACRWASVRAAFRVWVCVCVCVRGCSLAFAGASSTTKRGNQSRTCSTTINPQSQLKTHKGRASRLF